MADHEPQREAQSYESMLGSYNVLVERIRGLEERKAPPEEKFQVDREKAILHRVLEESGTAQGKSIDEIDMDILLNEGSLEEFGVKAPIIRLPSIGRYVTWNSKTDTIIAREKQGEVEELTFQSLNKPSRKGKDYSTYVASYQQASHSFDTEQKVRKEGDLGELDKWKMSPYFAIIFTDYKESWGVLFTSPLYKRRVERMTNLAIDFDLLLYSAHDGTGHHDYSSYVIEGVEVPLSKIREVAEAMRRHPEKYWLTKDELDNPYTLEYLQEEPLSEIAGLLESIRRKGDNAKWQDWLNFLKINASLVTRNRQEILYYFGKKKWDDTEKIKEAIEKSQQEDPEKAEQMRGLAREVLPFLESLSKQ